MIRKRRENELLNTANDWMRWDEFMFFNCKSCIMQFIYINSYNMEVMWWQNISIT